MFKILALPLVFMICVSCQSLDLDNGNRTTPERPYCFRFTWLGPKYNEESQFKNATCGDIVKNDKSVPCTHPLVVTSKSLETTANFVQLPECYENLINHR